jgi:hypothetical protein
LTPRGSFIGAALLHFVRVEEGQALARAAES